MEKKLELVERYRGKYGLNRCLSALGVSKSTWHRYRNRSEVSREDEELKRKVLEVVKEHPAYGYRRIKAELADRYGVVVNHKRLRRLLSEWDLVLKRWVSRPRPSGVRVILKEAEGKLNLIRGCEPEPFRVLCTDFTEIKYADGTKKVYLMAMLDPGSGWVAGWAVGKSPNRELALGCWERSKRGLGAWGQGPVGIIVHHDQDPVYTSYRWLGQLLLEDGWWCPTVSEGRRTIRGWSRSGRISRGRTGRYFLMRGVWRSWRRRSRGRWGITTSGAGTPGLHTGRRRSILKVKGLPSNR